MRLAPVLGICWLAAVALLIGWGTWKAVPKAHQVSPAKAPSTVKSTGRAVPAFGRSHGIPIAHLRDSDIRRIRTDGNNEFEAPDAGAEIERDMAEMRAEWETRSREMTPVSSVLPSSAELNRQPAGTKPEDIRITDRMLEVERRYAPRYLNCRIRIRLLESRLADASGPPRDALLRKLEDAKAELAGVDEAYTAEIEIARLKTTPLMGKGAQ